MHNRVGLLDKLFNEQVPKKKWKIKLIRCGATFGMITNSFLKKKVLIFFWLDGWMGWTLDRLLRLKSLHSTGSRNERSNVLLLLLQTSLGKFLAFSFWNWILRIIFPRVFPLHQEGSLSTIHTIEHTHTSIIYPPRLCGNTLCSSTRNNGHQKGGIDFRLHNSIEWVIEGWGGVGGPCVCCAVRNFAP